MIKKILIGNWKMNPVRLSDAIRLGKEIQKVKSAKATVVICAPFAYLSPFKTMIKKNVALGAQNLFPEDSGPYTGEISAKMLADLGVSYVIIGHSERRALGEDDSVINKKLKAALKAKLTPIFCVGEKVRDDAHRYLLFIKSQLQDGLAGIPKASLKNIIIAYEPIWAIGTGAPRSATPEESREMSVFIKKTIADIFGAQSLAGLRIVYGGSANDKDADGFLKHGGVDGLLVGHASLDAKKFTKMIQIANNI